MKIAIKAPKIKGVKKFKSTKKIINAKNWNLFTIITVVVFQGPKFGSDYSSTTDVKILFSTAVESNSVNDKVDDVKVFEKLEKQSDTNFTLTYLELSQADKEKIEGKLKEIEGYNSIEVVEVHKVGPAAETVISVLPVLLIVIFTGYYLLLPAMKNSRDKVGVALAGVLTLGFFALFTFAIFSILSQFISLNREFANLAVFWLGTSLVLVSLFISRFNSLSKNSPEANARKNLGELLSSMRLRNSQDMTFNLIILSLIVILLTSMIAVSSETVYLAIVSAVLLLAEVYALVFVFKQFFDLWYLAIYNLPIIKKLKWTRR